MSLIKASRSFVIAAILFGLEVIFFAPLLLLNASGSRVLSKRLDRYRPHFDPGFYLMQVGRSWKRQIAARDPLLHYTLIGWRQHRAPNKQFEPRFVREDLFPGLVEGDPFDYFLTAPNNGNLPRNEVEASTHASPPVISTRRALIFHHARGGGSTKFLSIFEDRLRQQGIAPVRLRAVLGSGNLVIWPGHDDAADEVFNLTENPEDFLAKIKSASIDIILVSHIIDFQFDLFTLMRSCIKVTGAELWIILHDYFCICPRVNLVDAWHRPCTNATPATCGACVAEGGGEIGAADPKTWRQAFVSFLSRADRIVAPSADASGRLAHAIGRPVETWHPETDESQPAERRPALARGDMLKVAVLGSLNEAKGSQVILKIARRQRRRREPVSFSIFGTSDIARELRRNGVAVLGRFADRDLPGLLKADPPHLVLLPAIWPETWSFVLTHALALGLPVAAFAHGAQYERLQTLGRTALIMPVAWIDKPDLVLDRLLEYRKNNLTSSDRKWGCG